MEELSILLARKNSFSQDLGIKTFGRVTQALRYDALTDDDCKDLLSHLRDWESQPPAMLEANVKAALAARSSLTPARQVALMKTVCTWDLHNIAFPRQWALFNEILNAIKQLPAEGGASSLRKLSYSILDFDDRIEQRAGHRLVDAALEQPRPQREKLLDHVAGLQLGAVSERAHRLLSTDRAASN